MTDDDDYGVWSGDDEPVASTDPKLTLAEADLREVFELHPSEGFYSRQLEVWFEAKYFDWITNRALRSLIREGVVVAERRDLQSGGNILLVWNRRNRYSRRRARRVQEIVEQYSQPEFARAVGRQGELLFVEGMARANIGWVASSVREYAGVAWGASGHDLDFIYERDGIAYGVEVKNALGRMEEAELNVKIEMCRHLGLVPFLAVRWMPKVWINRVVKSGGFVLVLKYQMYPMSHIGFAKTVREELRLPVDAPRSYYPKTVERIVRHHEKRVNSMRDSQESER